MVKVCSKKLGAVRSNPGAALHVTFAIKGSRGPQRDLGLQRRKAATLFEAPKATDPTPELSYQPPSLEGRDFVIDTL